MGGYTRGGIYDGYTGEIEKRIAKDIQRSLKQLYV